MLSVRHGQQLKPGILVAPGVEVGKAWINLCIIIQLQIRLNVHRSANFRVVKDVAISLLLLIIQVIQGVLGKNVQML